MNMECANTNCNYTGNDRMVSCWLCVKHYHLKCSGLKARDADALADPLKFINWTCPSCRSISIEFYKLFKNSKDEFDKINKEFLVLQSKFAQFGELFNNYPNLDKFVTLQQQNLSPKRKKANSRSVNSINTCTLNSDPIIAANVPESNHQPSIFSPSSSCSTSINTLPSKNSISSVIQNNCASEPISIPITNITNTLVPSTIVSGFSPIVNNLSTNVPDTEYAQPLISTPVSNTVQIVPKPLRAVAPNKHIFLSRLASETTTEDVEFYIRSKFEKNFIFSVYKYTYSQPRSITSFKITVPAELFKHLINPCFWPESTFVREYVYRERQKNDVRPPVRLPSTSNVQKN